MRVRCLTNSPASLPKTYERSGLGPGYDTPHLLTPGAEYDVHALEVRSGLSFLFVIDDLGADFPVWYPVPLFEVVDPAPSPGWVVAVRTDAAAEYPELMLAFPPWAEDPYFYSDLVSGDTVAGEAYRRWRQSM